MERETLADKVGYYYPNGGRVLIGLESTIFG